MEMRGRNGEGHTRRREGGEEGTEEGGEKGCIFNNLGRREEMR